jgi:hypothetical protein
MASGASAALLLDIESRTETELFRSTGEPSILISEGGYLVYTERNRMVDEADESDCFSFGLGGTTLAYARITECVSILMIVDRSGQVHALENLPPGAYGDPAVSPDGERIAALHTSPGENGADIWIYDRSDERLTTHPDRRCQLPSMDAGLAAHRVCSWGPSVPPEPRPDRRRGAGCSRDRSPVSPSDRAATGWYGNGTGISVSPASVTPHSKRH